MRLIDADELKKEVKTMFCPDGYKIMCLNIINNAPTVEEISIVEFKEPLPPVKAQKIIRTLNKRPQGEWIEKVVELFNKYDILLVHVDGKIVPVRNSTKQECYNLLYEIQELIEWRKLLWRKNNV